MPKLEGWDVKKLQKENLANQGIYTNINKRVSTVVAKQNLIQAKKEGKLEPEY